MLDKSDVRELEIRSVKENLIYEPIPEDQAWRISSLQEVIDIQQGKLEVEGFDRTEIEEIMEFICVS